ncbi:MAG: sulfatase-like hydrolase/transferase [Anaerolineales bacterium]
MSDLNRRDFLKLAGLFSLSLAMPEFTFRPRLIEPNTSGQNVLIVVFDAMTASNLSLYGYPRETMPHLSRLAEKATVYHQHYAAGPFTTPGTASLLTGMLPWTHRALSHNDTVAKSLVDQNIFDAFAGYHSMAYSHNPLANTLLKQFMADIDDLIPQMRLFLGGDRLINRLLQNDDDIGTVAWTRALKQTETNYSYSLFLSRLYEFFQHGRYDQYIKDFPRGIPTTAEDNFFLLEHGIDWLQDAMLVAPKPFLGYFHFFPPHFPYKTRIDFIDMFKNDGYKPPEKPEHPFAQARNEGRVDSIRTRYDEYLLYVDSEFNRLYSFMEQTGLLENTWLVFTSDHGELFERGIVGHQTMAMYQAGVKVPLLIFAPGQTARQDITDNTSAIDLLPTLLTVTGQDIPNWVEGDVLPPFAATPLKADRQIVCLRGEGIKKDQALLKGSAMLVKGRYKLVYIFGFSSDPSIELYDLEADPEELDNLYPAQKALGDNLYAELRSGLEDADQRYLGG